MALTPAEMDAAVLANLAARTGKDIDHWIGVLEGAPPFSRPAAAVAWLKVEHGLGHVTAQIIVRKWKDKGRSDPEEDPVAAVLGERGGAFASIFARKHLGSRFTKCLRIGIRNLHVHQLLGGPHR